MLYFGPEFSKSGVPHQKGYICEKQLGSVASPENFVGQRSETKKYTVFHKKGPLFVFS